MLLVHVRTNSVVVRLHTIFLAGLSRRAWRSRDHPGRGEESPAYAIEASDVTAKVGERAVMQVQLHVRDGYRILQSYNNRVIKLSAEHDVVPSNNRWCGPRSKKAHLSLPSRFGRPSPASILSTGFSVSATSMTATRWPWCRFASSPASLGDGIVTDAKPKTSVRSRNPEKKGDATRKRAVIGVLPATDVVRFLGWRWRLYWSA